MKNKITSFIFACLTFLITSCATESSLSFQQQRCEQLQKSFPDMVICLKAAVASGQVKEPRGTVTALFNLNRGPSSELKLYLLRAEQLSKQVKEGKISDLDARVELQKLYVELSDRANANTRSPSGSRDGSGGMSFMCKDAISRGDRGGIQTFCN